MKTEFEIFVDSMGIECLAVHESLNLPPSIPAKTYEEHQKAWAHDLWRVVLKKGNFSFTTSYRTGLGHRKLAAGVSLKNGEWGNRYQGKYTKSIEKAARDGLIVPSTPKLADVIYSLVCDAGVGDMSFSDWCSDFGYNTDSIKAREMYLACGETRANLLKLVGREIFEALQEMSGEY